MSFTCQGRRLGKLNDTFWRVFEMSKHVGIAFLTVDAKNDRAATCYEWLGFRPLINTPLQLVSSTTTFLDAFREREMQDQVQALATTETPTF
ncbi:MULTISPECIES: hypothetical protein [Pseudomonas]|uniref:hypothetical protein n=1 Tax=Pseudomonas TaxID=286 RepID=UPI0011B40016|nr:MULTISPECIES: hypothetical protein [unclassified Pseudomonas]MED5607163.1 hypothetical protein [Pseudomonas sp. JH-2]